ncbi:MAG: helix-turn-helix transcriptional regulator [Tistlia sp.]|uniref:helix-turn-helix domain-containing protein n=1 Tax=Tistlia sp. TaxID=3057121 RepID=UPI0034A4F757
MSHKDQSVNANSEVARGAVPSLPSYRTELGKRLREVEKRFKNREEAAIAAGVAKSSLQRWVEGRSDPSFEGLAKLAKASGTSISWLAYGEGSMAAEPASIKAGTSEATAGRAMDLDLMRNCIIAVEELIEELAREVEPTEKADIILRVYEGEQDARATGGAGLSGAEIVRLFRAA